MTQQEQVSHFVELARSAHREFLQYRSRKRPELHSRALMFANDARRHAYMNSAKVVANYWVRKLQREMRRAAA